MPVASPKSGHAAFQHVRENIDELNGRVGVQDTDLIFLKGIMDSPIMKSLVKVQDRLEGGKSAVEPVSTGNTQLITEVVAICQKSKQRDALELAKLLQDSHLKALLDAHDTVATKSYEPPETPTSPTVVLPPLNGIPADAIRMVGLRKNPNEPLGVTVKIENGELIIARILGGGMIDRQGLLRVGDTIKEVNGVEVYTPERLQEQLRKSDSTVNLKILPGYTDYQSTEQRYVKALYTYEPKKDTLLPCTEIGLPFKQGDILQVLNTQDPNWWQARKVGSNSMTGLIPSQELEERRKAFVRPEYDYATKTSVCGTRMAKKKKKQMYQSNLNTEFDRAELVLYEEVARMPPFQRKTLVLIGPQGVGRRTLKNRLISSDADRFGTILPHTSRTARENEEDGRNYIFTTQEQMEDDIVQNKYLEYGEFNGYLYGTKLESIRSVIKSGKMCILDCNPQGLKVLNSPEFMPFVIFLSLPSLDHLRQLHENKGNSNKNLTEDDMRRTLEESSRLQRAYEKYFDMVIVNDDLEKTYEKLVKAVNALSTEPQWVPVSWVY